VCPLSTTAWFLLARRGRNVNRCIICFMMTAARWNLDCRLQLLDWACQSGISWQARHPSPHKRERGGGSRGHAACCLCLLQYWCANLAMELRRRRIAKVIGHSLTCPIQEVFCCLRCSCVVRLFGILHYSMTAPPPPHTHTQAHMCTCSVTPYRPDYASLPAIF